MGTKTVGGDLPARAQSVKLLEKSGETIHQIDVDCSMKDSLVTQPDISPDIQTSSKERLHILRLRSEVGDRLQATPVKQYV